MDVGQNGRPRGPQMLVYSLVLTIHNFGVPNFDPYPHHQVLHRWHTLFQLDSLFQSRMEVFGSDINDDLVPPGRVFFVDDKSVPIPHRIHGAGIYTNIWGILMVNVTIYTIHGSYGYQILHKEVVVTHHIQRN